MSHFFADLSHFRGLMGCHVVAMSQIDPEPYAARELAPLLRIDQAARYLNVRRSTLYRLMRKGELVPSARVGERWRFRREDLDAYLDRSREPVP